MGITINAVIYDLNKNEEGKQLVAVFISSQIKI